LARVGVDLGRAVGGHAGGRRGVGSGGGGGGSASSSGGGGGGGGEGGRSRSRSIGRRRGHVAVVDIFRGRFFLPLPCFTGNLFLLSQINDVLILLLIGIPVALLLAVTRRGVIVVIVRVVTTTVATTPARHILVCACFLREGAVCMYMYV
jgi:hypothetical protein